MAKKKPGGRKRPSKKPETTEANKKKASSSKIETITCACGSNSQKFNFAKFRGDKADRVDYLQTMLTAACDEGCKSKDAEAARDALTECCECGGCYRTVGIDEKKVDVRKELSLGCQVCTAERDKKTEGSG